MSQNFLNLSILLDSELSSLKSALDRVEASIQLIEVLFSSRINLDLSC